MAPGTLCFTVSALMAHFPQLSSWFVSQLQEADTIFCFCRKFCMDCVLAVLWGLMMTFWEPTKVFTWDKLTTFLFYTVHCLYWASATTFCSIYLGWFCESVTCLWRFCNHFCTGVFFEVSLRNSVILVSVFCRQKYWSCNKQSILYNIYLLYWGSATTVLLYSPWLVQWVLFLRMPLEVLWLWFVLWDVLWLWCLSMEQKALTFAPDVLSFRVDFRKILRQAKENVSQMGNKLMSCSYNVTSMP